MRILGRVRHLLALGTMLTLAVPASAAEPSPGMGAATASPAAPIADLTARAMRQCTDAMNAHAALPSGPSVIDVFLEVAMRAVDDGDPPAAEELAAWAEVHDTEVDRLTAIRDSLGSLEVDDPAQQAAWDVIVGAADDRIAELERRAGALRLGDWPTIVAILRDVGGPSDIPLEASLESLGLAWTDCQFVFAPSRAPDAPTAAFLAHAADACTTIAIRRATGDFDAASRTTLEALARFLRDGPEALLANPVEGLDAAFLTLIEEWRATEHDFRAVDVTGAPDPRAWEDAIDYASGRVAVLQQRQRALASGDPEAVTVAFSARAGGRIAGLDWPALGLDQRSCAAVQA